MNDDSVFVKLPREVAEIMAQRKRGVIAEACRFALSESSGVKVDGRVVRLKDYRGGHFASISVNRARFSVQTESLCTGPVDILIFPRGEES